MSKQVLLTPGLRAQLEECGVDVEALIKPVVSSARSAKERPINHDLSNQSGKTECYCRCCGNTTTKFFDLVKREDCEGYAIRMVKVPANPVTITQAYNVISCTECSEDKLRLMKTIKLIEIICSIRKELVK
jgi:hypothetical protein